MPFVLYHKAEVYKVIIRYVTIISYLPVIQIKFIYIETAKPREK